MKVLVTGASGFVGAKIVSDLLKLGHQVTCCVRDTDYTQRLFPKAEILYCDFIHDTKIENWLPRLKNINVVINTVGIFYHPRKKIIWAIHYDTPHALFDACVISGVKKIIHISALGVDYYDTEYARSKKAIDDYLLTLSIPVIILRPSLIYGNGSYGGTSLFRGLVGLPVIIPLPGHGQQKLQPILCADLSIAISNLMTKPTEGTFILSAVSKEIISIKEILMTLREWLGFSQAYLVAIPKIIIRIVCLVGDLIPNTTMNSTAYKMLMQNNISNPIDTNKFIEIIQFQPLNFNSGAFHEPSTVQDRWHAKLYFIKPLL
ncbi:MAG: complex I NDUFA9 subunit family protein, partial [Gammaproteobacteria bacterium]|nr:complex I NDUFA9 subunit family protein [Gammaproteobacteria bacterium]